jgi:hypothetical protein
MDNSLGTGWVITWYSPKVILLAKSGIRAIHVWWTVENLVFQHTGGRKNDFASSIKSAQEPETVHIRGHDSRIYQSRPGLCYSSKQSKM